MKNGMLCFLLALSVSCVLLTPANAQKELADHNVLFLNSYSMSYTWADSVGVGVRSAFSSRNDLAVYVEFLDAKRFGQSTFSETYKLLGKKYRNLAFDVILIVDNDALDFMMKYGDSLFPGVPVVFCGINNPGDYDLKNRNYYGILEGIDLKEEIDMIADLLPDVNKLYFLSDSTNTTSLINLKYIQKIEPLYKGRFEFEYICRYTIDSLVKKVRTFEPGSAIALVNYAQDHQGRPLNSEAVNLMVTRNSPVPVFMESETLLGQGIAGGIILKGRMHGLDAARLALKFIDNHDYKPELQISQPVNRTYFDHRVLKKFNIHKNQLPNDAVVINKPQMVIFKYINYILPFLAVIGLLLIIVFILLINVRKRKRAESLVKQKLLEIQEKNFMLEEAHLRVKEMNVELEEINEHLSFTNEELRRAKVKSEESDRLKSAFLANMSHEIRTPLNAIVGFSSLMGDQEITAKDRETYFRIINSNSNQLLHIIDDILDLSRIEAGQMKIYEEVFNVSEVLEELTDTFRKSRNNPDVKLTLVDSQPGILLRTDPARFKQVMTNLISNALKFTRRGEISIGVQMTSPDGIWFYVKDTGVGISEKNLTQIFNRFWKSDEEVGDYHSGAGLGLAICRSLCDALGSKIWAESQPGVGSVFYVSFPAASILQAEKTEKETVQGFSAPCGWKHVTIAIAEDELSNQYLLSAILKDFNANVICFRNGKEIVEYISDHPDEKIHLILMDLKMPEMDGFMANKLIREMNRDIPVIAQTAYAMVEDIEKIKAASFTDYIVKPIKQEQLIEKIKKLLLNQKVIS